jgi:hypothetical protein
MEIHKLGKHVPKIDPRTLKMEKYMAGVTTPPPAIDYVSKVTDWGMMLNDTLGDCVVAAAGHMVQQWTDYATFEHVIADTRVLRAYEEVGGYVPGDPSTDNGLDMLSFLNYWRKTGLGRPQHLKHRIAAYVLINPNHLGQMKQAIMLFGNVYLGLQLPVSVQGADAWDVPAGGPTGDGAPGSWGGHCVPIMAYDSADFTVVSWGTTIKATPAFIQTYADEAYAVLSREWLDWIGRNPMGFDFATLEVDLSQI